MRVSEILEGLEETTLFTKWSLEISVVLSNYDTIADAIGRKETTKKLMILVRDFNEFDKFAMLGDNDPKTRNSYEEYIKLCAQAKKKIQSGL